MGSSSGGKGFLDEFREFVTFLQSLWGILAGVSVLFPLATDLGQILPLGQIDAGRGGGFEFVEPALLSTLATLVALFVLLSTFGQRHAVRAAAARGAVNRQAWGSFGAGLGALVIYLALTYLIAGAKLYGPYRQELAYQAMQLAGDLVLLACYVASFSLIARGFELLAIAEYFSPPA